MFKAWVTDKEIDAAKEIGVLEYLMNEEPDNLVKEGFASWHLRDHDSLKISNGMWHWFSQGIGGRNALSFLIKVRGVPFVDAVQQLLGISYHCRLDLPPPKLTTVYSRDFKLPKFHSDINRVRRYLTGRGISENIIEWCYNNRLINEEQRYHDCVFIGYDGDTARFGCVRGTDSDIKKDLPGSDKRFSFAINAEQPTNTIHIFEAAIDLLSYATLLEMDGGNWRELSLLSVSGVSASARLPLALETYLRVHDETDTVIIHFDNDAVGENAAIAVENILRPRYTVITQPPPQGKDYNDYLMIRRRGGTSAE